MTPSTDWKDFKLETPATYRIRVQGHLDSSWVDQVTGMSISVNTSVGKQPVSTLVGHLTDEVALSYSVKANNHLCLTLLSVENLDEKRSE